MAEDVKSLLTYRLLEAAREGRVDDVNRLSKHFTGEVCTLGGALKRACGYCQLNVVTWLVEHTVLRNNKEQLGEALKEACMYGQWNIVKWLVYSTQVDVNYADKASENTSLHNIVSYNTYNKRLLHDIWSHNMKKCVDTCMCVVKMSMCKTIFLETLLYTRLMLIMTTTL
jgi:hypothetical protein